MSAAAHTSSKWVWGTQTETRAAWHNQPCAGRSSRRVQPQAAKDFLKRLPWRESAHWLAPRVQ
eukprot:scaffold7374_cov112-Isochrysis_galbana.AAC.6